MKKHNEVPIPNGFYAIKMEDDMQITIRIYDEMYSEIERACKISDTYMNVAEFVWSAVADKLQKDRVDETV